MQSPIFETVHKMLEQQVEQETTLPSPSHTHKEIPILPWHEFNALSFPPQQWFINNLIPAGALVIIAAPSGEKKSWVGMHMAAALSQGKPFAESDEFKTVQSNVLYIEQETPRHEVQRRGRQLGFDNASSGLWVISSDELSLNDPAVVNKIYEFVEKNDIKVIFVDTLRSVAGGILEEKADQVRAFFQRFKRWKDEGKTVVFLDHCRKPQKHENTTIPRKDQLLGSQDKVAAVEVLIMLKSPQDSEEIALYVLKNKMAKEYPPFKILIKDSESEEEIRTILTYGEALEERQLKKDEAKGLILGYLWEQGGKKTAREIKDALEGTCGKTAIEDGLVELRTKEEIGYDKQGKKYIYWHPEKLEAEAESDDREEPNWALDGLGSS